MLMQSWAYLYQQPQVSGDLRTTMSDFKVIEQLPFTPCGEGEHLFIQIRKTGQNTTFVANQLAKYFGVKPALVTYAGLKDRFAETEQWFGVHLPGKQSYDLSDLNIENVQVLQYHRHHKKLKIGALSANRFELILRNVTDLNELSQRWHLICEHGVPNYFGEQRFGIDGGNIERAKEMFAGKKVKDRQKRSMYLSAARAYLFNYQISQRIKNNQFEQARAGDVMMLAGSQSIFHLDELEPLIAQRLKDKDIDITACMWGAGALKTSAETAQQELALKDEFADFCHGLIKFGLKQERRRIRLVISNTQLEIDDHNNTAKIAFTLPAGCFATSVMRELLNYQDLTMRQNARQGVSQ